MDDNSATNSDYLNNENYLDDLDENNPDSPSSKYSLRSQSKSLNETLNKLNFVQSPNSETLIKPTVHNQTIFIDLCESNTESLKSTDSDCRIIESIPGDDNSTLSFRNLLINKLATESNNRELRSKYLQIKAELLEN